MTSLQHPTPIGTRVVRTSRKTSGDATSSEGGGQAVPGTSPFLLVDEVAVRLRCSRRKVAELTRLAEIPHRKLPGSRRCLFVVTDLEQWEAGCELEVVDLARGGRIVRPKGRS